MMRCSWLVRSGRLGSRSNPAVDEEMAARVSQICSG